jgi:esterase/lipase superfamily enzyme
MLKLSRILLLSFLLAAIAVQIASASERPIKSAVSKMRTKMEKHYVQIPVLYLTDRAETSSGFSGIRKYIVNCKHLMNYGTAKITVEADSDLTSLGTEKKLDWKESTANKAPEIEKIKTGDPKKNKAEFFANLKQAMERNGSNQICIFVHGAADPFDDAALDAAMLAYQKKCPMVLYSWPSIGKLKKYHVDEGNCEWTQQHFDMFWKDMEAFAAQNPVRITLVAHSMGNRVLARGLPVLSGTHLVSDVALVSPDIDAEVFQHDVMHFQNDGVAIRLYFSERDKVLSFTQMVYGGYYRLGEDAGAVLNMFKKDVSEEVTIDDTGAQPVKQPALKIDFTKLDRHWVGHHFPYSLVASMSNSGKPPEGYELVKGEAHKGNVYTRYESWHNDLKVPVSDDSATCLKVVKTSAASHGAPVSMKLNK